MASPIGNRVFVDRSLVELRQQRDALQVQLEQLDGLSMSQAELRSPAAEAMRFLESLRCTSHEGVPEEKRLALRQCVKRIYVNKAGSEIKLIAHTIPLAGISGKDAMEMTVRISPRVKGSRSRASAPGAA